MDKPAGLEPEPDELGDAMQAYRERFGEPVQLVGVPLDQYPALAALLRRAVADGRELSDADVSLELGLGSLPPGAVQ